MLLVFVARGGSGDPGGAPWGDGKWDLAHFKGDILDKNIYLCTSVNYFKKKYILKKRYGNIF